MAEHSEHINQYSAADFERYYAGKMSALEMHQLEKAALDDPFLADALEGYQYTSKPAADSNELQKALLSKLDGAKVISLEKRDNKSQLLKIAAMLVLIAGTAWFVYRFAFNDTKNDMAVVTESAKQEPASTDSSVSLSKPLNAETKETPAAIRSDEKKVETTSSPKKQSNNPKPVESKESVAAAPAINNKLNGIATETADQASNFNNQEVATSNSQAAPTRNEADSVVVIGYGTQRKIDASANNVIVMQRAKDSNMQEIVLGKSKSDSVRKRGSNVTFEDVEPEKGATYYSDYIAQNLTIPEDIKKKNSSGEVQLSFDVNELGEPVNIKVEKSLCEDCDKEAVRLLKEGPKWNKKKNKKGKLKIRF